MNEQQEQFVSAVADLLRMQGMTFHRGALIAFVAGAWPLIEEDQDAGRWSREFAETLTATAAE